MSVPRQFFDTNIFVYSVDRSNPIKQEIANTVIRSSLDNANGAVSYQVVQEFLNVSLKGFSTPIYIVDAFDYIRDVFESMFGIESSVKLFHDTLAIHVRYKLS